eukprot:SAG11_NODE_231_length_11932_cov_40.992817_9_plen_56_part_00
MYLIANPRTLTLPYTGTGTKVATNYLGITCRRLILNSQMLDTAAAVLKWSDYGGT